MTFMTKNIWRNIGLGLVVVLLAIQLIPSDPATNPPVVAEVAVPDDVRRVLRQSCYDCHSNETHWPWYSGVAPAKWFVRGHVAEAREDLNFSAWNEIAREDRPDKWGEVAEEVEEGHMPLRSYLILHPEARLTDTDRAALVGWAERQAAADEGQRPQGPEAGGPER